MITPTDVVGNLELLVREDDPRTTRFVETPAADVSAICDGEVLLQVEKFGFTANNVTYAVLGKSPLINYFDFFPSADPGWGKPPVWGIGRVALSRHPDVPAGGRLFGYFPLARYARMRPARASAFGFDVDRGALPAAYNSYAANERNPFYVEGHEDAMIVFRPLMLTGILLDDFLAEGNDYFGARSVVIPSASSKTAFGLAFMLARRRTDRTVVGLTSARNSAFVRGLGLYSRVVTYDEIATLADEPTVVVDVAGDARVRADIRKRLGDRLRTTVTVGLSHWDQAGGPPTLDAPPGEPTLFFFAPAWLEQRRKDLGAEGLNRMLVGGWLDFIGRAEDWVHVVRQEGRDALASVYASMVDGRSRPDEAHVLSL
ncbi:MAG TPA: DUF2855 family protein [Candidatus Binatia bacterium]|jgi:hypothetical protein